MFSKNMGDDFGDFDIPLLGSVKALPLSCRALKQHPRVSQIVSTLWGSYEFFDYVDSLLYDSARGGRDGFDPLVYTELAFLKYIFETRTEEVMNPFISDAAKKQIRNRVRPKDPIKAVLLNSKRKAD